MSPVVPDNEVDIWFCCPETIKDKQILDNFMSVLSGQEREKYHKFRYHNDKQSYLVSHAMLRFVLSEYVDMNPAEWGFDIDVKGKPYLAKQPYNRHINFNLTHTSGLSACVVAFDKDCGIDAENIHRNNKLDAVARRLFATEELRVLKNNNFESQRFFDFWTLREAYVKALGLGLADSSTEYYFTVDMKSQVSNIHFRDVLQEKNNHWRFNLSMPTPEHKMAVAIRSIEPVTLRFSEFIP